MSRIGITEEILFSKELLQCLAKLSTLCLTAQISLTLVCVDMSQPRMCLVGLTPSTAARKATSRSDQLFNHISDRGECPRDWLWGSLSCFPRGYLHVSRHGDLQHQGSAQLPGLSNPNPAQSLQMPGMKQHTGPGFTVKHDYTYSKRKATGIFLGIQQLKLSVFSFLPQSLHEREKRRTMSKIPTEDLLGLDQET